MTDDIRRVLSGEAQWAVVCGDSLQVLPTLPAGAFGAVVTDPPYNVGLDYDSIEDSRADYPEWCARWFAELRRVCSGPIAVSCGQANVGMWAGIKPPTWWLAWHKPAAMGRCVVGFNNWEPIALWGRPKSAVSDVIRATIRPDASLEGHPCPKPLEWAVKQVAILSDPGDIILDPFLGSGTTLLAAVRTGRRAVGIEISPEYAALARRRLEKATSDGPLFAQEQKTLLDGLEGAQ